VPLPAFFGPLQAVPAAPAVAGAVPAAARAKRLNVAMERPQPTEWCWAATTAAVTSFYAALHHTGQAVTACQVATDCLFTPCCPEPTDPADPRNREYALEGALSTEGHLAQGPLDGPLDFAAVMTEIDADRPVCCRITWEADSSQNAHFNAIVGYHDDALRDLDVSDCLYGDHTLPYDTFAQSYQGKGRWAQTYLTS